MIGDVSENSALYCGQCNEEFLISEWLRKYDKDLIRRANSLRDSADSELRSRDNYLAKPSGLRWLPMAFYIIAVLGFVAFLILAVQAESGYLFGYGIGATIACLGSGRLIELLQEINDELYTRRISESP